jgi:hypothetical protein
MSIRAAGYRRCRTYESRGWGTPNRARAGKRLPQDREGVVRRYVGPALTKAKTSLASCRGLPVGQSPGRSAYICRRSRCFMSVRVSVWMYTPARS